MIVENATLYKAGCHARARVPIVLVAIVSQVETASWSARRVLPRGFLRSARDGGGPAKPGAFWRQKPAELWY